METLNINEIYVSIQGESTFAGLPCIFVRTTACNLRCSYCDTAYAFTGGTKMSLADIEQRIRELAAPFSKPVAAEVTRLSSPNVEESPPEPGEARLHPNPHLQGEGRAAGEHLLRRLPLVELTGGEPLLQKNALPLMKSLCDDGFTVLVETSGALDISSVDARVHRIMDLKCPSSGESDRMRWENLQSLKATDEIKFVIGTREDYEWAREQIQKHDLSRICPLLFSWVAPLLPHQRDKSLKDIPPGQTPITRVELVERIVADALPVRFQLQMHKFIWPPDQKGV